MRDYTSPRCGNRPVDSIDTGDALAILSPIPARKPETAKRVRQRIETAMKWALANGHRPDNPVGEAVAAVLPKNGKPKERLPAMPWREVPAFVEAVRAAKTCPAVRLTIEFAILTAARSGEARDGRRPTKRPRHGPSRWANEGEGRPSGSVERPRAGDLRRGANPRRWKRPGLSVLEARQGGGDASAEGAGLAQPTIAP